ncbi:hypothetical protein JIG36_14975 [Actinoplanes sp. LDG1-06]|uniref:Uncharacterized protein n=1 Tax=Paractinoplanes ovalisporus TaxID=2810368 RepID=A0ABS2AAL1_9ACTN|nr:hypothetical protein [Actinoplanes ovalisporus]MBM2616862.1 hypothetical protein [Actinoplanes ovalisporus]
MTDLLAPAVTPSSGGELTGLRLTLPQFNYAGFCRVCIRQDCADPGCAVQWPRYRWELCPDCGGTCFSTVTGVYCAECIDGLVEVR